MGTVLGTSDGSDMIGDAGEMGPATSKLADACRLCRQSRGFMIRC
jgi:hypothetical protein